MQAAPQVEPLSLSVTLFQFTELSPCGCWPALHDPRQRIQVVLGAAVWPGGEPSPTLLRRTLFAVDAYKHQYCRYILFTGGVGVNPPAESEVMQRIAAPMIRIATAANAPPTTSAAAPATRRST